ncbi:hypothetical protein J4460_02555 [Candidatus Woesearchaeota archaeon]|nr:MAG: hypothetical protein QS99_C0005G0011 [archaeon GW2011_AR4]MBS3129531.1 hypothetical protein [Candidatus Woesearchaeota archaeon]HIH37499.1 hypothetical protein [Candidatus Woesearchaeota archaeon]HIH49752.1 hypothetical protein [Candidatus Woesearchaeota archaeon]HIJ03246.1 hypothetical protein [Candidatus Woesearchaeota archaeon]
MKNKKKHPDITFLLAYTKKNMLLGGLGTLLGYLFYTFVLHQQSLSKDIKTLYWIVYCGGFLLFLLTSIIAYQSTHTLTGRDGAGRIAGRRGLFTFTIMTIIILALLVLTKMISWQTPFLVFLQHFFSLLIVSTFFALPLDYGIAALIEREKSKR